MQVFLIGVTGAIGRLLAQRLSERGDDVRGLVRKAEQRDELASEGITATVGDLSTMSIEELAATIAGSDVLVYTAGSNGGSRETTKAIDGDGVEKAIAAAGVAGVERFALVSVLPEAGREGEPEDDVEYYFLVKKQADIALSRSDLNWLILRPSRLTDDAGIGTVSMGPAEPHGDISREDVAATLAPLLHEPRISRQILELNTGTMPIDDAVLLNVR